jgi:NAD(P)-dependent dehydrogenase (short-subunit alcohol dehydrogenase family)
MSKILVTGSSSGLGLAIFNALAEAGHSVVGYDSAIKDNGVTAFDVRAPNAVHVRDLCHGELDVLINCAGVNIINWLENFSEAQWDLVMDVNAKGIFKMSQVCLSMLARSKGTIVNVVSNAAHMPMTCSLAYNASKGAAHIMTLQLARELTKKFGITVFGIAPNKLKGTGMSDAIDDQVVRTRGWTKEHAQAYQLQGLLTGEETPPESVAAFLEYLLRNKDNHRFLTGTVIPYGA